jgi:hypothetical protein
MLRTKVVGNIKAHILCAVTFFPEMFAFYEMVPNNMVEPDRQQLAV